MIGAGLSGLSCARALSAAGIEVTVLEKSRSLGGRCATRKWDGHLVDHGAQYFTMRDESFRDEIHGFCGEHLRKIEAPIVNELGVPIREEPRWYHVQGNNRLGKALAAELSVRLETPVTSPERRDGQWLAAGGIYDAVVSSAPWPQTLALLGRESGADIFAPCLTAFFSYRGPFAGNSAHCYARTDEGSSLSWSACENHKTARIENGQTVFVAQASPEFSVENLEADPNQWATALQQILEQKWELPKNDRLATFTHRWRFARYLGQASVENLPDGFFVTGDVRTESRVESAWIAGRTTASETLAWLK